MKPSTKFLSPRYEGDVLSVANLLVGEAHGLVECLEHTYGVDPERLVRIYTKALKRLQRRGETLKTELRKGKIMKTRTNIEMEIDNLKFGIWDSGVEEFIPIDISRAEDLNDAAVHFEVSEALVEAIGLLVENIKDTLRRDLGDIWERLDRIEFHSVTTEPDSRWSQTSGWPR